MFNGYTHERFWIVYHVKEKLRIMFLAGEFHSPKV